MGSGVATLLPLLSLLLPGASSEAADADSMLPIKLRLKPTGERTFVDSDGRERYFHGTNVVTKGWPWVPATDEFSDDVSMVDKDFEILESMGLNMIRLGTMWPGIEPRRGQYNHTYLDEIDKITRMAAKRGFHVVLDMHQDILSEMFCGEGIPVWAVHKDHSLDHLPFPEPVERRFTDYYAEPLAGGELLPSRQECSKLLWWKGSGARDVAFAYDALYRNANGTADSWAAAWGLVAARFAGRAEVLGLELMNEPSPGDFFRDPDLVLPWPNSRNADRVRLEPVYARLNKAIRAADEDALIFFAGINWDDFGPGFSAAPGGEEYADRSVLAYHYYEPIQVDTTFDVEAQLAGARRLQTASFLTETCSGSMGGVDIFDAADAALQSWAYWEYKSFVREDSATVTSKSQNGVWGANKTGVGPREFIYRTFASAVAGNATAMFFDSTSKLFQLDYIVDLSCRLPTEIRLSPQVNYPHGFRVMLYPSAGVEASYDPASNPYLVTVSTKQTGQSDKIAHGQLLSVTITANSPALFV